jgi:capsular polysaccharide transport system permease protein
MTEIMVAYVIFSFILAVFDTRVILDFPKIINGFAMAGVLAFGVGVLNSFLFSMVPIWQRVWSIINRPMFIISGIFFTFETIPQPYRDYLWYNPLIHVVGMIRSGFYPTYNANYVSPLYVYGVSLLLIAIGLLFLRRHYRSVLDT